jgi:hypothetical protein
MIKLARKREPSDVPSDFKGQKLAEKQVELLGRYFDARAAGRTLAFTSAKWKSAKAKLRIDTVKKCAYCEAPTSVVAHGDVEHFRPKSVYWWLAYCFDNYLFSCQICNQLFKSDAFPISGTVLAAPNLPDPAPSKGEWPALTVEFAMDPMVVTDQDCLVRWSPERADLVHPYFEDPEPLFRYEIENASGEVWLRAGEGERALRALNAAEVVLGLNREDLRKLRYEEFKTIATFKMVLEDKGLSTASRTGILREFARRQKNGFPFAGMHRYFARAWDIPVP